MSLLAVQSCEAGPRAFALPVLSAWNAPSPAGWLSHSLSLLCLNVTPLKRPSLPTLAIL